MGQLINDSIPNLVNGVSQQPDALRLATQSDLQVNAYSTVVSGLSKRPPTYHIATLGPAPHEGTFFHTINRDTTERYLLIISNGSIKVYDDSGVEKVVHCPHGLGYLSVTDPATELKALTVADYTFILNRKRTVTINPYAVAPTRPKESLIYVKAGNYGKTYNIFINGYLCASYKTGDGSVAAHAATLDTSHIAAQLTSQLATHVNTWNGTPGRAWGVSASGSTIHFVNHHGEDYSIRTEDGYADQAMIAFKAVAQRFSDLPIVARDGYVLEIAGDQTTGFGNYYVRYKTANSDEIKGIWVETIKPGTVLGFDPTTLPHALKRNSDGSFTFEQVQWGSRTVGDGISAPDPSFVGRTIEDLFFHRNRLGFLSDENVVFSKAGDFHCFWPTTVTSVLDDDPIDVAVSHIKVSKLRHAIPFSESLYLFSEQTQFRLSAEELLTPKTAAVSPVSEYELDYKAKPVGAGTSIFFVAQQGDYSSVREYYVDVDTETNMALDVTGHVPRYLPSGVMKLVASSNLDILGALTRKHPNRLYLYKYYYSGQEKLQSSWSYWDYGEGTEILNADFIETELFLVIKRGDRLFIERQPMEPSYKTPGMNLSIHLDRMVRSDVLPNHYDKKTNKTSFTLPYSHLGDASLLLAVTAAPTIQYPPGVDIPLTLENPNTVSVEGDFRTKSLWLGSVFTMRYRFPKALMRTQTAGGGVVVISSGRLQLRNVALNYADTGYFRVEVTPLARKTYSYDFTGRIIDAIENVIDQPAITSGVFRFPVLSRNDTVIIDIVSDSYLPCSLLSAEWEGFYSTRSRRF